MYARKGELISVFRGTVMSGMAFFLVSTGAHAMGTAPDYDQMRSEIQQRYEQKLERENKILSKRLEACMKTHGNAYVGGALDFATGELHRGLRIISASLKNGAQCAEAAKSRNSQELGRATVSKQRSLSDLGRRENRNKAPT